MLGAKLYNLQPASKESCLFFSPALKAFGLDRINLLGKRHEGSEVLWIKFCIISLFEMH